jgi:hypothetical protein
MTYHRIDTRVTRIDTRVTRRPSFVFGVVFCILLLVIFPFVIVLLSFLDLQLLITLLVSSKCTNLDLRKLATSYTLLIDNSVLVFFHATVFLECTERNIAPILKVKYKCIRSLTWPFYVVTKLAATHSMFYRGHDMPTGRQTQTTKFLLEEFMLKKNKEPVVLPGRTDW